MDIKWKPYIDNIKSNIIDSLQSVGHNVDVAVVTSIPYDKDYDSILGNIKYRYLSEKFQFSKICEFFSSGLIDKKYDWYIKLRPDLIINEKFTNNLFEKCCKNSINARVRKYIGPEITIQYGVEGETKARDIFYWPKLSRIHLDDVIYIFHNNVVENGGFSLVTKQEELINMWPTSSNGRECESYHSAAWVTRGFKLNPISLDVTFRNRISNNLNVVKSKKPTIHKRVRKWEEESWFVKYGDSDMSYDIFLKLDKSPYKNIFDNINSINK